LVGGYAGLDPWMQFSSWTDEQRKAYREARNAVDRQLDTIKQKLNNVSLSPREKGDWTASSEILSAWVQAASAQEAIAGWSGLLARNTPVDIEMTLIESMDPSKFVIWADAVLTASKSEATKQIVDALDPVKKAADRKAEVETKSQLEDSARQAYVDAKKAELDLSDEKPDSLQYKKDLLDLDLKKRKANGLYAQIGWVTPFSGVK